MYGYITVVILSNRIFIIHWTCLESDSPVDNFTDSIFNTTNSDDDIHPLSDSSESILQEEEDFVSINHLRNVKTSHIRNYMATK